MVAYSFNKQFVAAIEAGAKRQTVRSHRRRHTRAGERVQIYYGLRTKQARKLIEPDPVCVSVQRIAIDLTAATITLSRVIGPGEDRLTREAAEQFAIDDGFACLDDLVTWFGKVHGPGVFHGVLVRWRTTSDA